MTRATFPSSVIARDVVYVVMWCELNPHAQQCLATCLCAPFLTLSLVPVNEQVPQAALLSSAAVMCAGKPTVREYFLRVEFVISFSTLCAYMDLCKSVVALCYTAARSLESAWCLGFDFCEVLIALFATLDSLHSWVALCLTAKCRVSNSSICSLPSNLPVTGLQGLNCERRWFISLKRHCLAYVRFLLLCHQLKIAV